VPTGYWEIVDGSLEATGGRIFAAGSAFGAGALRDEPSPVTMTATDSSWLLELPVGDLRKMLERYPKLGEPVDR
jgi:CRP-like cAMP-binding protein